MAQKRTLATALCLILIGTVVFSTRIMETVQSSPEYEFTIVYATTPDPYWGGDAGLHDCFYAWQDELAQIGIGLEFRFYDSITLEDKVWRTEWNVTGAEGGWDIYIFESWYMPTGLIWLESYAAIGFEPPDGYNVMPWQDEEATAVLRDCLTSIYAEDVRKYIWRWEEILMQDVPTIDFFFVNPYDVTGAYVEGWDPVVWWYDISHMDINLDLMPDFRKPLGETTLRWGIDELIECTNPLFMASWTQEAYSNAVFALLYRLSREPWPDGSFKVMPHLASGYPTWLEGPRGPNTRVRVPIRQNVIWSDGEKLNATDVWFTFDVLLDPETKCWNRGDFAAVIENVTIVDEHTVDFYLWKPDNTFLTLLCNSWGGVIIPEHTLRGVPRSKIEAHETNYDFSMWPASGPFKYGEWVPGSHITMVKNPDYFGYKLDPPLGPYNIETLVLKIIPEAETRIAELQSLTIDFSMSNTAPVEFFENPANWPYHNVYQYNMCTVEQLILNLNNPDISNRYVRQAMAHCMPRQKWFADILPAWGLKDPLPGKAWIPPTTWYTDPNGDVSHLYNELLPPYPIPHNIEYAQKYMDMWRYSRVGTEYTLGPIGDSDLSGFVDLDDFILWAENYGTTSADWTAPPGEDIDPDFDNTDKVDLDDFIQWAENFGMYYPERSRTHEWSRVRGLYLYSPL